MIYIYDILLNFNKSIYEYYEWNRKDNITHIKRIKLFKVSSDCLNSFFKYDIKINREILNILFNKTEVYRRGLLEYCAMFTDGYRAIAIMFDKKGNSTLKSRLVLEEEEEILVISKKLELYNIKYKKLKKDKRELLTREDEFIKNRLNIILKELYNNKNISVLKYLYLDYFDDISDDIDKIYNLLKKSLLEINDKHKDMLEILNSYCK